MEIEQQRENKGNGGKRACLNHMGMWWKLKQKTKNNFEP